MPASHTILGVPACVSLSSTTSSSSSTCSSAKLILGVAPAILCPRLGRLLGFLGLLAPDGVTAVPGLWPGPAVLPFFERFLPASHSLLNLNLFSPPVPVFSVGVTPFGAPL